MDDVAQKRVRRLAYGHMFTGHHSGDQKKFSFEIMIMKHHFTLVTFKGFDGSYSLCLQRANQARYQICRITGSQLLIEVAPTIRWCQFVTGSRLHFAIQMVGNYTCVCQHYIDTSNQGLTCLNYENTCLFFGLSAQAQTWRRITAVRYEDVLVNRPQLRFHVAN